LSKPFGQKVFFRFNNYFVGPFPAAHPEVYASMTTLFHKSELCRCILYIFFYCKNDTARWSPSSRYPKDYPGNMNIAIAVKQLKTINHDNW